MMNFRSVFVVFVLCCFHVNTVHTTLGTTPTSVTKVDDADVVADTPVEIPTPAISWETLDQRVTPKWYDEAKIGIFLHWGVFSVPSYKTEWFLYEWNIAKQKEQQQQQESNSENNENDPDADYYRDFTNFVNRTEKIHFSYSEYATRFTTEFYEPTEWVNILEQSGAQYVVLNSKHHDGYCMWNSTNIPTTYNWNVMDVGPRRDLLGELSTVVKNTTSTFTNKTMKFGIYHSLFEWFHPAYLYDKANQYTTQTFVQTKTIPELYDLVMKYEPELLWSDGEWEANSTYWETLEFIHWYSSMSPIAHDAVYNDRWGNDTRCRHGSYVTCDDRYDPDQYDPNRKKFENAFTIDSTTWGYSRTSPYTNYLTTKEIIHTIVKVVAFNGNVLINIGPAADGTIHPIFVDRLMGIGKWLRVNGDAIYQTRPWDICQNESDSNVYYTQNIDEQILFVHFTEWPKQSLLHLNCPIVDTDITTIQFLGTNQEEEEEQQFINSTDDHPHRGMLLRWTYNNNTDRDMMNRTTSAETDTMAPTIGISIELPLLTPDLLPCDHSWVLVMKNVQNLEGVVTEKGTTSTTFSEV